MPFNPSKRIKITDSSLSDQLDENCKPTLEEQLAFHCLKMFSTGLRIHTYGGLIDCDMLSLHQIDRAGRVVSEHFDMFKNWGLFTALFVGLSSFDAADWGFLPYLEWDKERCPIPIVDGASELNLRLPTLLLRSEKGVSDKCSLERHDTTTPVEEGIHLGKKAELFPSNLSDRESAEPGWAKVTFQELTYVQHSLVGRGTALFRVQQEGREGKRDLIVKISSHRSPERLYLRYARKGLAEKRSPCIRNLPVLVGWTQGCQLSEGPRANSTSGARIEKGGASDRMVHVLALPVYTHIYKLKTEEQFKTGMTGCVNCKSYRVPFRICSYVDF
jgi:hypothetical protein